MLALDKLEINDVPIPYYSAYTYVEEIEYTEEPKRGLTGKIVSWPSYYFIPVVNITWNFLTHLEYQNLMSLVRLPDFKFRYFDPYNGVYKVGRFYVSDKSYNAMVAKEATLTGYEGISLKFICTNNDVDEEV